MLQVYVPHLFLDKQLDIGVIEIWLVTQLITNTPCFIPLTAFSMLETLKFDWHIDFFGGDTETFKFVMSWADPIGLFFQMEGVL